MKSSLFNFSSTSEFELYCSLALAAYSARSCFESLIDPHSFYFVDRLDVLLDFDD